ncbi:hypothetical protein BASA83_000090 [Batrachochytrium salamandrivorans]|nr:hypothetical protein BASA83_000090 [Batrachochytrium salamandrivorans]
MAFVSTSSNKYARQKLPSSYASYSTHDALIAQNTPETEQTSPVSGAGVSTGQKSRTSNSLIAHNGQPHRSMKSTNRVSYTQHPHVSSKPRVLSPDHVSRPIRVPTVMWSKPADQLISHQDGLHQRKRHIHSSMVKLKEKLEAGKTDVGKRSICHGCQQASINQQRRDIKDCDDIQSYNIIQVKGSKERSGPSHSYPTKNRHKKSTKQSVKTATIENRSSAEIRNLKRLLVNKSVMENLADNPSVAEQNTSLRPPALVLPAWEGTLVNESEISILANARHKAEVGLNRLDSWARISNGLDAQPSIMNQSEVLQKDGFDSFDSVFTARNDYVEPNKIASHLELFLDNMRRSQRMAEFSGLKENAFKVDPKKMPENMRSECIQIGKSLSSKIIQLVIMYNTYMEYMDDAIAEEKDSV